MLGTHDWSKVHIVLDVPPDSVGISIGMHFSAIGEMWVYRKK
jgi:hypothetical protein